MSEQADAGDWNITQDDLNTTQRVIDAVDEAWPLFFETLDQAYPKSAKARDYTFVNIELGVAYFQDNDERWSHDYPEVAMPLTFLLDKSALLGAVHAARLQREARAALASAHAAEREKVRRAQAVTDQIEREKQDAAPVGAEVPRDCHRSTIGRANRPTLT